MAATRRSFFGFLFGAAAAVPALPKIVEAMASPEELYGRGPMMAVLPEMTAAELTRRQLRAMEGLANTLQRMQNEYAERMLRRTTLLLEKHNPSRAS